MRNAIFYFVGQDRFAHHLSDRAKPVVIGHPLEYRRDLVFIHAGNEREHGSEHVLQLAVAQHLPERQEPLLECERCVSRRCRTVEAGAELIPDAGQPRPGLARCFVDLLSGEVVVLRPKTVEAGGPDLRRELAERVARSEQSPQSSPQLHEEPA